jgi:uncharacterized protein (UPF0332 family)
MKDETRTLILYRLERANESLDEANILMERGHANTFVNRLYYACFYAVSALLLTKGLSSAKHSGVRALFHQNFVKESIISKELGQIYDKLFDNRQKGDYVDMVRFDLNIVRNWYDEAKEFVKVVGNITLEALQTNSFG